MISTAQFSLQQVNKRLTDLAVRIRKVRQEPDHEAVHALRVSIRQLQPVLDVFEPCFAAKRVKSLRKRLKAVLALAGDVRDCDLALALLSKHRIRGIAGLRAKLQAKRNEAASHLSRGLEDPWQMELAVVNAQRKVCRQSAHATGRRELEHMAVDFFESGDLAAASSNTSARRLHKLRIAVKKLRYALDLFVPLLGRPARVMLSKTRELQRLLGSVNNQRATRDVISALGGEPGLEKYLKKKQRKRVKRFRQTWKEHFPPDLVKQWIQALRKPRTRTAAT